MGVCLSKNWVDDLFLFNISKIVLKHDGNKWLTTIEDDDGNVCIRTDRPKIKKYGINHSRLGEIIGKMESDNAISRVFHERTRDI